MEILEWGQAEADKYRRDYDSMTWEEKRSLQNELTTRYYQIADLPSTLLESLVHRHAKDCRILELGGYSGQQALQVLLFFPQYKWTNMDVSPIAKERTIPNLSKYHYEFVTLWRPIWEQDFGEFDIFYSSKVLEHMRLREVFETLEATQYVPIHIHIVDNFYAVDTHVLEPDALPKILGWYAKHEYEVTHGEYYRGGKLMQYRIMAGKNLAQ